MQFVSKLTGIDEELRAVGASVGTADFLQSALALIAALVPNDMQWLVLYEKVGRPRVLHFRVTSEDAGFYVDREEIPAMYESGYYRFDPIYRYWREIGEPGVCTLHHMPVNICDPYNYISEFLPITYMEDEAVVLFDYGDDRAMGLCLSRSSQFKLSEVVLLRSLHPLLAGLFETHLRLYAPDESDASGVSPTDAVSDTPLNFSVAVEEFLPNALTPREREIVKLVLAGYPNSSIANQLGIGEGTTWNHKKRIYGKLDITAERELFSLFIGFLAQRDASELLTAV